MITKRVFYVLLVSLLFCLVSCDPSNVQSVTELSPPSWIFGTWGDPYSILSFKFSTDHVLQTTGSISLDFNQLIYANNLSVSQHFSESEYSFTILQNGSPIGYYQFIKLSSNSISCSISSGGVISGPCRLPLKTDTGAIIGGQNRT